jgi:hypothetical protein
VKHPDIDVRALLYDLLMRGVIFGWDSTRKRIRMTPPAGRDIHDVIKSEEFRTLRDNRDSATDWIFDHLRRNGIPIRREGTN